MAKEATAPFKILDCALSILALGKSAQNLRELRDHLAIVPVHSIAHHFYDSLLRPTFDHPEFRNDFARWARGQLHDGLLAERLGVVDPIDFEDFEHVRHHLLDVVEDRLSEVPQVPQAAVGQEFHFLRSQFIVFDTGLSAATPEALASLIPKLSTGSIFFHLIEGYRRPPLRKDDFSVWLEAWGPRYEGVRERLSAVDFYLWSLTELRERVAGCFDELAAGAERS